MATPSPFDLHNSIVYHKACLATAEEQLKTMYPGDLGRIYTVDEEEVLALSKNDTATFRKAWRKVVIKMDLVENIERILEECRDYFLHDYDGGSEFQTAAKRVMGTFGSKERVAFTLNVIRHLKEADAFGDAPDLDNFEDTAGGCDEATQEAAISVIEASFA